MKIAAIVTAALLIIGACDKPKDPNVPSSVTPPPAVTSSAQPTR